MRPRLPRRLRRSPARDDLRTLVDECIVLADCLLWVAEHIHGDEGRRSARRGILRGLARYGAQSVPQLARARSVTRQNVQPVVDALVSEGLAVAIVNPRNRRSPLFAVTERGMALAKRFDDNDSRVLAAVARGLSADDLSTTSRTLRLVRERFELKLRWRSALEPT